MRILVLNNYDLARVAAEVAAGAKPAHHLFGFDFFEARGWQVDAIAPGGARGAWHRLGQLARAARWPIPLGDLGQQAVAWRQRRRYDLIYAPCQTQTQMLSYLRASRALATPLVTLAHHPCLSGRLAALRRPWLRQQLRGTDRFPALSARVAGELRELRGTDNSESFDYAPALAWGPDLAYYDRYRVDGPGRGVVATGRTGRDWPTFGRAASEAGVPAEIVCLQSDAGSAFAGFGEAIKITASATEQDLPYSRLLPLLARARVVAIPLLNVGSLAGLTSLTDALGLGKPVIMTRHPLIDLDVEREKIGCWVELGDVAGWRRAMEWFEAYPDEAATMGRRARQLAEAKWNYRRFSAEMAQILEAVVEPS